MLHELSIRNFAIIDDLSISFSEGLTILSGETGAGKSIIINAVNLLLGSRATSKMIRTGADSAELEAFFHIEPDTRVGTLMKEHGYDPSEGLLIRRVISSNDRHRIYINGRMATIQVLTGITENLASISGQHAHQGLLKEEQHLLILDQYGGLIPLREEVKDLFGEIQPLSKKLRDLKKLSDRQAEHIELLEFQKKEIEDAAITPGEDEKLEHEKKRLKNGELLYQTVHSAIYELYTGQGAVAERMAEIKKSVEKGAAMDELLQSPSETLEDLIYRIEDVAGELRNYRDSLQLDEGRLEEVESRLDILNRLKRKYGGTLESLFEHYESISGELSGIGNLSESIEETELKLKELHGRLVEKSLELSEKRKAASAAISGKVEEELAGLEMGNSKFEVVLEKTEADSGSDLHLCADGNLINENGLDRAVFMIAPNVGEALKPLAKIASGGELSRVVLALKAILSEVDSVETVVFDEVDSGIGGSVAEVVGKKIASLAGSHQILCITHLPQIAKFGDHHFKISKAVEDGRTSTTIKPLADEERLEEVARMLGGIEITQATLDHAKEMLESV